MSNNYTKDDFRRIAEYLVEELRECDDGTVTTTAKFARARGYDNMDESDLFELHDALFRAARANHITLDMSQHKDTFEGLPFCLTFIVRNKKAQYKCPRCGSRNTGRYIYGLPAFSEKMQMMLDTGKWVLGGCCLYEVEINGQHVNTKPTRKCNDCGKDFGTVPILITRKKETAEDYRDIVTSISFKIYEYRGGYTHITIRKNADGASVKVDQMPLPKKPDCVQQISSAKWTKIVNALYGQIHLHEWKKNYLPSPDIVVNDGLHWSLTVRLTGNRKRSYSGDNCFPPYWDELLKVFRGIAIMQSM